MAGAWTKTLRPRAATHSVDPLKAQKYEWRIKKRAHILGISSVISMSGRVPRFRKEVQTDNYCFVLGKKKAWLLK